jgi:hypothetical protein
MFLSHAASATIESDIISNKTISCSYECVEVIKLTAGWHVVAKNSNGDIETVIPIDDIPMNAKKRINDNGMFNTLSVPGVGTTSTSYEAPTEIVVVYITTYRDSDGNLLDVQVTTVRIPKDTTTMPK